MAADDDHWEPRLFRPGEHQEEDDVEAMVGMARIAEPSGAAHACVGCGGLIPNVGGPTHPYMLASPGCWRIYGEISARWHGQPGAGPVRWHHIDAYAVQHPAGAEHDRRQRQSVAVHLVALCLLLEAGQPPEWASARRGRTSQVVLERLSLADWPYLEPPSDLGAVTIADIHAASSQILQEARATAWLQSAWTAWEDHHPTVRTWTAIMQEARP